MVVMIGWVLFRAHTLGDAMMMYQGMAGLQGIGISDALGWQVKGMQIVALVAGIALVFVMPYFERGRTPVELSKGSSAMKTTPNLVMQAVVGTLFVIAVSRLLAMSYSPFLYFQF